VKKFSFFVLIVLSIIIPTVFAVDILDTKGYFPIDQPHGYTVSDGALAHRYQFLGLCTIENKSVFMLTKTQLGTNGQGEKKELYSEDINGDIFYLGYVLPNTGKAIWEENPSLILKRKMPIGKPYPVATINNGQGNVSLTLKKIQDVKLKKTYRKCLIIEKCTRFAKKLTANSLEIKTIYFYAQNIGVIKSSTASYRMKSGKLTQDGPAMSEWISQ
jgi:hypothetical protein